jgi:triacylglycerol esterase/lipase EstA (alpha/beta hydrolase family)
MAGIAYAAAPIQFSYRYPSTYTSAATYDALPTRAVQALHATIAAELLRCPDAQIDLIGHSLGGAVILRYLAQYGATPEGLHVLHAVTLDSPVNGTSHTRLVTAAALLGQTQLAGSQTGLFLARESRNSATRTANATLVRNLAPHTSVRTLESADDWIVPARDAEITGASVEFHLGRNYAACMKGIYSVPSCLGHDRILHDARALTAIHTILAAG